MRYTLSKEDDDYWRWEPNKKGCYVVKEVYNLLEGRRINCSNYIAQMAKLIWGNNAVLKIQVHVWRLLKNRIPTLTELKKRKCIPENSSVLCARCNKEEESVEHAIGNCRKSAELWTEAVRWLGVQTPLCINPRLSLLQFSKLFHSENSNLLVVDVWLCTV